MQASPAAMRVLIAFDKFKHALSAPSACALAAEVVGRRHPDWSVDLCPLTDGGEGFGAILGQAAGVERECIPVSDPVGANILGDYYRVGTSRVPGRLPAVLQRPAPRAVGVVEMASASGLELLAREQRDPWRTSTFGTGQLLAAAAVETSALLLGIGGSATNDLGCGALAALGCKFLTATGKAVAVPTPVTWEGIVRIDARGARRLPPIFIACDVTNPLLGPAGATAIFGPQKGLAPTDTDRLETQVERMARLLCAACDRPLAIADTPGAGAAGGLGFGLMVASGAELVSGFDVVSGWLNLPARLAAADVVITGEGRYDATSLAGKVTGRLAAEARRLGKTVHVFAGSLGVPPAPGLHAISPAGLPLDEALLRTVEFLRAAIAREV